MDAESVDAWTMMANNTHMDAEVSTAEMETHFYRLRYSFNKSHNE